ncbi:MAG: MYXO-CTERM sorting domain-containing protein [Polyangiaceae bacterium]
MASALCASTASADLIPSGFKSVKLSIQVEAQVPEGRALLLANTFQGASVITGSEVQSVDWHPMAGDMRLISVSAADAEEVKKLSSPGANREKLKAIFARAQNCSEPIQGVRTLPESNPADEVRWRFRVSFKGASCQTDESATLYLNKEGKIVGTAIKNGARAESPVAPNADTPAPVASSPSPATPTSAPPPAAPPAKSGCGSCVVGSASGPAGADWTAIAAAAALALLRRRRRF